MKFPSAGYVTMGIRYSFAGTEVRSLNVYLDHDYIVKFKPTANWDTWDTAYVDLDLINGEGILKFISMTENGGPNIDAFGFSVDGVERIVPEVETTSLKGNILSVAKNENTRIDVFDMSGRLVARKLSGNDNIDLSGIVQASGIYRIVVRNGKHKFSATWANVK